MLIGAIGATEVIVLRHVLYERTASALRTELALLTAGSGPAPAAGPSASGSIASACTGLGFSPRPPLPAGPRGGPRARSLGRGGASDLAQVLAQRGVASAVVGSSGATLACASAAPTGSHGGFGVPQAAVLALARDRTPGGYVTLHHDGYHLLAIAQAVGGDEAILVTDLASDDAALGAVTLVTVVGGLAALVVAMLAARPLLRSGLAPLRKVAATADAVASGELDRRADLQPFPDEVGRLGAAFDRMVDRLQTSLAERDALVGRLAAREETMRRFLADASHELRTPLTAIRGSAQVLGMGAASDPADLAEGLAHIQAQAERMSRLVSNLLILSRGESGAIEERRRRVDLAKLVNAERAHLAALAGGHPLSLETEPALVQADGDALVRLVGNLVENAAKYTPEQAPIEVKVSRQGEWAVLTVTDHGPGIPPAERERVFERFYRGDPARARATGGSGLGLSIVAAIASGHGGSVWAEEAPGGGARLVTRLPIAPEERP